MPFSYPQNPTVLPWGIDPLEHPCPTNSPSPTTAHMPQQLLHVNHAPDNGRTTTSAPVLLIPEPWSLDICLHVRHQCSCCTKPVCTPDSGAAFALHMAVHQTWHYDHFVVLRHQCYLYSEHNCMPNPAPRKILATTFPCGE